tara:strand:- start:734 stop:2164 length:1431 start_codon:yes stop_codon:yes gene_type:complete
MTNKIRNICCVGAGYVGGPTMAVIADNCPDIQINVVDMNIDKINSWNDQDLTKLPVYEPDLDKLISRCRGKNLHFSTKVEQSIANADIVFLSVNTPTKTKGLGAGKASDLKWIEASARQVASCAKGHTIVVEKSTIPVRTAETIQEILRATTDDIESSQISKTFSVISNPEFLAEGTAIRDLINPDRVLIGGDDPIAVEALANLYEVWVDKAKIIRTNLWSSELSKLTANAFLAQRISSINSIAAICEATGADVEEVANAIGSDSRIGKKFLKAGPGFGGSCFQKDILNLVYLSGHYGLHQISNYWQQVIELNSWQQNRISANIVQNLFGTVTGKRIAIFGFAFKANTNDTRESPAIRICNNLLEEGAKLAIYDPKVSENQIKIDLDFSNKLKNKQLSQEHLICLNSYMEASEGSDAIVVLTEWSEFSTIDWNKLSKVMRKPSWLFDLRRCVDAKKAKSAGMKVWILGSESQGQVN